MSIYYKLEHEKNVVPCTFEEFKEMSNYEASHAVARTSIGVIEICTRFIGLGMDIHGGFPLLFQTTVSDEKGNYILSCRYSTWERAVKGHDRMVRRIKNRINHFNCQHEWDGKLIKKDYPGNFGLCKHCGSECIVALKNNESSGVV